MSKGLILFWMKLAMTCQGAYCADSPHGPHRIDELMQLRIWKWFSDAQKAGIVLG